MKMKSVDPTEVQLDKVLSRSTGDGRVQRWDEWFANCGDEQAQREWAAAKSVHAGPALLDSWATIIEMNRIDRLAVKKKAAGSPAAVAESDL